MSLVLSMQSLRPLKLAPLTVEEELRLRVGTFSEVPTRTQREIQAAICEGIAHFDQECMD